MKNKGGRPKLPRHQNKGDEIKIRCSKTTKEMIRCKAKSYGLTLTDYILKKSLEQNVTFNHIEYLKEIHELGTELARQGNNINQLAKHANTLNINNKLTPDIATTLERLLKSFTQKQEEVRIAFRTLIREMGS